MNGTSYHPDLIKSTVLTKSLHSEMQMGSNEIPKFYYPKGKPRPTDAANEKNIMTIIGGKNAEVTN